MRNDRIVWWFAVLVAVIAPKQGYTQSRPVSLNYWDLVCELERNEILQAQVEVSPGQLKQLRDMRSRKDLEERVSVKVMELALSRNRKSSDLLKQALSELDDVFKKEFTTILAPSQLDRLVRIEIVRRFPIGYLPFKNGELLQFCSVSKEEQLKLPPTIAAAEAEYEKQRARMHRDCSIKIVASLSPQAQNRFVQYAGNKYLPGIPEIPIVDFSSIPFPPTVKSIATLPELLEQPDLVREIGLTNVQVEQISLAHEQFKRQLDDFLETGPLDSGPQAYRKLAEALRAEFVSILRPEQLLALSRRKALLEFERSFTAPFRRPAFREYLNLPKSEEDEVFHFVQNCEDEFLAEMRLLNRRTFDELCKSLPIESRVKYQTLFDGAWELVLR